MRGSWIVRTGVGLLVLAALSLAIAARLPSRRENGKSSPDLPAVALGQESIYRLEIFLAAFYGGLLLLVPAYRGLVGGRLPIEISARGAKYAEETADSIEATQELVAELEQGLRAVEASAMRAHLNIDQLAEQNAVELRD